MVLMGALVELVAAVAEREINSISNLGAKAPYFIGEIMFNLIFNKEIKSKTREKIESFFELFRPFFEMNFIAMEGVDIYFAYEEKIITENNEDERLMGVGYLEENLAKIQIYDDEIREKDFVQLIFHELNHVYRGFYERDLWLMSNIIPEGLAINFERQIRDEAGVSWQDKAWYYFENEKGMILKRLTEAISICENKKDYNYNAWMYNFNGENPDFPHNLGYKIGDFLVGEYCKFHKIKPIEAVRIPTMEFIKFTKKEILKCEK